VFEGFQAMGAFGAPGLLLFILHDVVRHLAFITHAAIGNGEPLLRLAEIAAPYAAAG
jgi:hypothetical protein